MTAPRPVIEVEHLHKRYPDTVAVELHSDQVTLDDAFLALTGRPTP